MEVRRILILTYYWPPSGGGGVQRWMYFALYLKELGFTPTVITVHPDKASYPLLDPSQLELVREVDVIYTNTSEPLKLYSLLKSGKKNKSIPYGNLGEGKRSVFNRITAFIRANFYIPDARKGWLPYVKKAASGMLEKEKFEWLITTGPPHSTHLAGIYLKQKYKVRWLADFRDPWSEIYFLKETRRLNFATQKDQSLEEQVLNTADLITTVGPGMAELLDAKIRSGKHSQVLYNGYDKAMFEGIERPGTQNARFTASHIGLLGDTQRFDSFIEALKISGVELSRVCLHLAGSVHPAHLEKISQSLPEVDLLREAFIPRKKALRLMKNSNLLLLCPPMVGETKLIVSTKTMEYLAAGIPIIGIGDPGSDAAFLVKQQNISGFYAPDQIHEMAGFIQRCFTAWEQGKVTHSNFDPEPYSRFAVSEKLAELLNRA